MGWRLIVLLALATGVCAEDWKAMLAHRRADRRVRAADELGLAGAADAVPELIEALYDDSEAVRAAAIRALVSAGPAANAAAPHLMDLCLVSPPAVRSAALRAMRPIGAIDVLADFIRANKGTLLRLGTDHDDVLRDLLAARSWHVRQWVLQLKHVRRGASKEWAPLFDALARSDSSGAVRRSALFALAGSRRAEARPLLAKRLASKDPDLRAFSLRMLGRFYTVDEDLVRPVTALLTDEWPAIRASACVALAKHPASAAAIEPLLKDANPKVQQAAAVVLAFMGRWPGSSGDLVLEAVGKNAFARPFPVVFAGYRNLRGGGGRSLAGAHLAFPYVAGLAHDAILKGGKPATTVVWHAYEAEPTEERRINLVHALGHLRADPALAKALADKSPEVRRTASACRMHMGLTDLATIRVLMECLSNPRDDEDEREWTTKEIDWTATAVELVAAAGADVLPALEARLKSSDANEFECKRIAKLVARIRKN